uniref:CCHC-type domain-containing protein n=1 Tax=Tanacetum cinerariifolium TaxID=118510 RepID=A0A6L2LFC1_TANCI|nr:hypothetical protein [Tanacetum cinerariifolium]
MYSCELCGNDAHYSYDCPPQVSFVYNQDLCFNQNFDKNFHELHQGFHNNTFVYLVIHHPPQETSVEMLQARENLMKSIQTFLKKFDYISLGERLIALLLAHERFSEIKQAFREEQHQPENIQELLRKLLNDLQVLNGILLERGEHATQISTPYWNCPVFYDDDDDDDEYSIQYREYLKNSFNAITPDLPIKEPDNSLSMGDEHLDTIPETKSNDVIKFSLEDLVPIPTESEGISDDTCEVPFCDNSHPLDVLNDQFELFSDFNDKCTSCEDFSPIKVLKEKFVTFSNPLFNSDDDFTSSDDESLSDEDVPKDNVKKISNPLFEFDDEYSSSDINPLFDEVLEDIKCKDSYDSNLNESTFLVTHLSDSNEDEYFTLGNNVELLLYCGPSTPIMSVVSILKGFTDKPPLKENDDLFDLESKDNDWKNILYDAPIDDLMTEDKIF